MNHCLLMGEIVQAPQLRYTSDTQTPIAEFVVQFAGLRAEDAAGQMKVIGWGNLAQEIQTQYKLGDRVLLEGRLTMNTVDRPEGFKEKQVEMTAQRVHSLASLQASLGAGPVGADPAAVTAPATPAAPAARPAASAVPPPAEELDYDDIPF